MPSFIDLFSGAGGLTLGLSQAGWSPLAGVDFWEDAGATYRAAFPGHEFLLRSVESIRAEELMEFATNEVEWLVGGPPCQGFSTVGKRNRSDPRNQLIQEFLRIVAEIRPRKVLIENVLGLRDMSFIGSIVRAFHDVGYRTTPLVLRAADFGVPQLRRRVFFIAARDRKAFLPPSPAIRESDFVSVWDAIGDLPELEPGESKFVYDRAPKSAFQQLARRGSDSLQGHKASRHPPYLIRAISFIPDGGNRRHIPPEYQPRSGFHNSYSRLDSRAPAVAVTQNMGKPSGTRCIHPFQHRGLTAREGARLQSFPDTFHFQGGVTSQRLQVANAVPPRLASSLATALDDPTRWVDGPIGKHVHTDEAEQFALPLATI